MKGMSTTTVHFAHRLCFGFFLVPLLLALALEPAYPSGFAPSDDWGKKLPQIRIASDVNNNGINDTDDIILGAREEVGRRPIYRSSYHPGGYPPAWVGVCTDVIWRAFTHAGYNLKAMIDRDIRTNPKAYPRVAGKPDPNIDFRRVPNMTSFFKRHARILTKTIKPGDAANLALWQGGDIVVFANPDHIAILSDKRNAQGVPLLLHNDGPWASEGDDFMRWYGRGIVAHFRFPR